MKQQQEMYWDEENEEFVVYEAPQGHGGNTALYIVGYFFVLAVMMVPAQHFHLGMQGIFFAMIVAGAILGGGVLIVKFVRSRIASLGLTKKGFAQMMVGFAPDEVEASEAPAQSTSRALVPSPGTSLVSLDDNEGNDTPDRIVERDPMDIAEDFRPSVHTMIGTMILLCGIRRSGKSNLLAVLNEELGRFGVPSVVFDTEDEYSGLVDKRYLPHAVHVGSPEDRRYSPAPGAYVGIDIEGAYAFGQAILDGRLQAIVNLKSWGDDDAAIIMSEIIVGLNEWEEARENKDRLPVMLFLDEAQKWLPQNLKDSYVTRDNQTLLHQAFFDIAVARGGKRGFGLVCATQRYSQLNKNVLQSQWKFLLKQSELIDVANYVKQGLAQEDVEAMQQGEAFIFRLAGTPNIIGFKTKIRQRYSPNLSSTPSLENLQRTQGASMQDVLSRSFAASAGVVQAANELPKPRTKTDLERVIEVYRENPGLSYRDIAAKVGFGKDKVGELLGEAKDRGMLE